MLQIIVVFIGYITIMNPAVATQIVTLDQDTHNCLTTVCTPIQLTKEGLEQAHQVITKLKESLRPHMPAAGLAAPQIGISQRIFIFSWDRSENHLIAAINPSYEPVDDKTESSWEGCFSVILGNGPYQVAYVPRHQKIKVTYYDRDGKRLSQVLEGFAARVFQHEYDHLNGIENVHRDDTKIKTFETRELLFAFMNEVKKTHDSAQYVEPQDLIK